MIGVIDYGVGNIQAFLNCFKRLDISAQRVCEAESLANCTHLILPGVGRFDQAMSKLRKSGLVAPVEERVFGDQVPILGVCVGMQMLGTHSAEGDSEGLNWIPGNIEPLKDIVGVDLPLPHMGWNTVETSASFSDRSFLDFQNGKFYFLHSFFFQPEDPLNVLATASYGEEFPVAVSRENICGVQFHPEKSHQWGARLLHSFAKGN